MASDWIVAKLGDVLEIKYGKDHKKLNDGDIPCFGSGGLMRYVENSIYEKESILIPRKGSLNNIYYVDRPFWTVDTLFWTKINSEVVFPKFLFYQLKLTDFVSLNVGSAVPSLTVPVLNDLKIKLPTLSEQKTIAYILGSLDDKIELNRQMNETLETMAQALFKSWFVDFDPVIDNALAAGNAIPDEFAERAEQRKGIEKKDNSNIQNLFPDEFEFTEEMGWIPKGWVIDDISSLCEKIQSGGTPRRNVPEYWEDGTIPWLTSGEVRQTIIITVDNKISESGLANSSAKWLVSGTTVVAMYGATAGQVAYIDKPLTTNQAVCGLTPKKGYQFFNYVTLSRAVAHFEGRATGSAQQNINKGMIETTRVVVPSSISSDSFEEYCEVVFSKWIKNLHENETLAKLRDTLLPKLMSGELRISDTEVLVDEVL